MKKRKPTQIMVPQPRPLETITYDLDKLDELRRFYNAAVKDKVDTFHLDGHEYFVPYAKYLIQYLEMFFDPKPERR